MNCQEARELFSPLIDDELALPQREAVCLHLSSCPACAREYERWHSATLALRGLADVEFDPPPDFRASVMARLESDGVLAGAPQRRSSLVPLWRRVTRGDFAARIARPVAAGLAIAFLAIGTARGLPSLVARFGTPAPVLVAHSDQGMIDPDRRHGDDPRVTLNTDGDNGLPSGSDRVGDRTHTTSPAPAPVGATGEPRVATSPEQPRVFLNEKKISINGLLSLEVQNVNSALDQARALGAREKASFDSYLVTVFPDGTAKHLVRITLPKEQFDSLWKDLRPIGSVITERVVAQDISNSYIETAQSLVALEQQRQSGGAAFDDQIAALRKRLEELDRSVANATIVLWLRGPQ